MRRLLAVLIVAATAAPAQAALPPNGRYDCVIGSSGTLFGTLVVKGKTYKHRGTKGTLSGTKKDLRLKGGDLGGMRGRWYKSSTGPYEIALRNPKDDFESIYCTKS
jgi:hypothetical protein